MQSSVILSSSADKGATVSGESRLAGKDTVYLSFSKTRQLGGWSLYFSTDLIKQLFVRGLIFTLQEDLNVCPVL